MRWTVEAGAPRLIRTDERNRHVQELLFSVHGPEPAARVKVSISKLGEEGLREQVPSEELGLIWRTGQPESASSAVVRTGEPSGLRFFGIPRRALRIELSAGSVNDGRR